MQKVVGSSPIIRSHKAPHRGFFLPVCICLQARYNGGVAFLRPCPRLVLDLEVVGVPRWPMVEQQPTTAKPRLLVFYSARDGKARRVDGYLAQILQRRRNHETFVVHRVDVNDRADLAKRLRVTVSPSLLVVDGNKVKGRLEKPRNALEIQGLLAPWLR
jgi:hypothetical protein